MATPATPARYEPKHKVRFVTAASLFDGHDAAINIMRRILQAHGAEVVHLGHNRSVADIVEAAIQEDAQAIAVSSYQGGHLEFFKYMIDLLRGRGAGHILVFGGGGGVIVPREIAELEAYGVAKIFSPEDGRAMGLDGMIDHMIRAADFDPSSLDPSSPLGATADRWLAVARAITRAEEGTEPELPVVGRAAPVLGITGTGGAGKSSVVDELVLRFLADFPELTIAILSVDPTKRKTGGALLGDRIRLNSLGSDRVFMRSLATRQAHRALSANIEQSIALCRAAGFDLVLVESSGIGQADSEIVDVADLSLYVMTPEYGAAMQLEKIDMLDFADFVAINKFDRPKALDALRDVRKQYRRSRGLFAGPADDELPVYATIASQFHDRGVNSLYQGIVRRLQQDHGAPWTLEGTSAVPVGAPERHPTIPGDRVGYLRSIARTVRGYKEWAEEQVGVANRLYQLVGARAILCARNGDGSPEDLWRLFEEITGSEAAAEPQLADLDAEIRRIAHRLENDSRELLAAWPKIQRDYASDEFSYTVRGREIHVPLTSTSLAGTRIPKVQLPRCATWPGILRYLFLENVPGAFPYTAGVFPLKRTQELPTRMFAGEGGPERTNERFHLLAQGQEATRLSTAFDSVTLYGEDPAERPDIWGKVGESGVSICTVEDVERLYAGFDLCDPTTSVSMTINGPAPMMLAMFFNAAARQQARKRLIASKRLKAKRAEAFEPVAGGKSWEALEPLLEPGEWDAVLRETMQAIRGTVQADILKEDQAQNTCIFSTEFALRMMGDIQRLFCDWQVRNFYSVSISGYHIAEAGANPITQLAFTLANGFTYVETYLARGMDIDDFAPNLSFFFSNGMDPEYTVIGRVARRIWSTAIRNRYGGNERSQKLKYHIQTSGRSLHAMEIAFNDIRTTLQGLLAMADNCNSLHTNAYDEAITTPTPESVRRAVAIQLINALEFGLLKNENPLQGSQFVEWLTDVVEEAVLDEFERLSERGDVLGAMESMYQRGKIQEESLHYERLKHTGEHPIVGVNTFIDPNAAIGGEIPLTRATSEEKNARLAHLRDFQERHRERAPEALARLQRVARDGGNIFEELLATVRTCSLGQISNALYEVGGQYRRNM
ncbi:MAG TPA: methylmalonyl-CoA mutase family protein [Thermoanaerobaculales bacterium]|nr:methylmalonyl-CoA mutase family protein [Thermoanaerobaculales bacterium]HQP42883.1 methylmalonyl-CoA mutase family protein [Thermoanaerobaculales bacterium]